MPLRFKRFERIRSHFAFRFTKVGVAVLAVTLAVAIVATLTVDLGPSLRALAEREGSKRVGRPMHIGRLGVRLVSGKFVIENFVIEGLVPTDRPFLTARSIDVSLTWDAMLRREVLVDSVVMTDWHMVLEQWAGGKHSFPKFNMGGGGGPRRFVTTMQYVRAKNGTVTFDDHGSRWGTVTPNMDIIVTKLAGYRGEATFHGGTVWIQDYVPMSMSMKTAFRIEDGVVHFERMTLLTDGARSDITGDADVKNWPEMTYRVRSSVDFKRMRELFFAKDDYTLSGEGRFNGVFHLFKGGRALTGDFESDLAGLQIGGHDYEFPHLKGRLGWYPDRFEVMDTTTGFYGGEASLKYSILSSGKPGQPSNARFDTEWRDVDLSDYTDFLGLEGVRLSGRWSGRNLLAWPMGRFRERSGGGSSKIIPPAGTEVLAGTQASEFASGLDRGGVHPPIGHLPIAGEVTYRYDQHWLEFSDGRFSTPDTDVTFSGRTAWGDDSRIPFHVTSADLQESDRVLAAMMTAFGAPTKPITVGGTAQFSGVMTEALNKPRVEGHFVAEDMRAFDVNWGEGEAGLVIQNSFVDVTGGRMQKDAGEIVVNGRFSLGFPRRDKGEEISGRIRVAKWTAADFKHAFEIDDYDVNGMVSGEYHLYGPYQGPFGFGTLTIENGLAYGEPFETVSGALRFEGNGVRIDGIQMRKSGGTAEGAAFVGWNGTYSFNATGRRIPLEGVKAMASPQAPLTGLLEFNADGTGTFEVPRYQFRGRIRDLFVADEGVGEVTGRLDVRGNSMTIEIEAASPRLAVSGTGRIDLTETQDADITLRFTDTSLDPYARAFEKRFSPFTTAVGSGTLRVIGELANPDRLVVDVMFDQLQIRTFDYLLRNAQPIRVLMHNNVMRIDDMRFVGDGTELDVTGTLDLNARRVAGLARGTANLGILQGFYRNIRSSGNAQLTAQVSGSLDAPIILGRATIDNGRLRYFSLPHSLEAVNGTILFDSRNVRLDGLTARVADGQVTFDGRIGLESYAPADLSLTATGRSMRLRYPEGVRSEVDVDLSLTGRVTAPVLSGMVTVQNAVWTTRFDAGGNLFDLGGSKGGGTPVVAAAPANSNIPPIRLDVRVISPGTLRIENNDATIVSSADLTFRGTYERPIVFGSAEISRGEFIFEGRRYVVTRGRLDFTNPVRIEPTFDIAAETQVRVPRQTYRITLRASGTMQRLRPEFSSDPPLPQVDVMSLLLGDLATGEDADLRALSRPDITEQQLVQARVARMLVSPISGQIGEVVEQTFGVDTFQLTPLVSDPMQQSSRFNPSARLTIGKRISNRAYLTFSRSISSTSDQIILLEYDQTDRISWILTRNEDDSYALDIRVRKEFLTMRISPPEGGHDVLVRSYVVSGFSRTVVTLSLILLSATAYAAVTDYIGKPVVEVRLQLNGAALQNAELIEMIETRTGAPLAIVDVRESMAHLFGLGLYQDVQVDASVRDQGVVLTYNLFPAQRVRRIVFEGSLGLSEGDLRRIIVERHGASPSLARSAQAVATLQTVYRDRGYPKAEIAVRAGDEAGPSYVSMIFSVRPGPRARIGTIEVQGAPREPAAQVLTSLGLRVGDAYDGVDLDARLVRYANALRAQGYYEARVAQFPRYVDDDTAVNLVLSIEPGPRVEIVFEGDPLAAGDRDRLVPIAREHSVDEDLLEDSKFGIERHFRERGYCNPRVDYQRGNAGTAKPQADADVMRVTFTVTRGPQCMVEDAEVTGNTSITSAELAPLVVTKAGQPFSDSTVSSDALRIQGYYRQRGFTAVKVTSQVERREPKSGSEFVRVGLVITEGVRSVIDSVTFQGNPAIDADTLRRAIKSAPGQPYFEPQISDDADTIAVLYLNSGYPEVTVEPAPKAIEDGSKVELGFAIHEGPKILIDHVLIVGNQRTSRDTIMREVQLKSGQPLSQQHEDETRTNITSLGLFRRVDISYLQLPGEQNRRDVVITVEEAPVTTISYGGGLEGGKRLVRSSETADAVEQFEFAPRGFFQVSRRNLFGKNRSLDLFTRVSFRPKGVSSTPTTPITGATIDEGGYGFNEYVARLTFLERRILGTDADATISAGVEQAVRSSFDFNRKGASATITRRINRTLAVSGRYGIDRTKLLNIKSNFAAQPEIDRLFPQVRISSVASSLIRDTRNDSIEPNSGSLIGVDAELAARRIGSEVGFVKTFVQGFTYRRMTRPRSAVIVLGGRVGLARGFPHEVSSEGSTIVLNDLPASERFFAGGDTTVRGFTLDRLGTPETIDQDGFPTGGQGLVVLNLEARIPLRGGLGAVAFIDGGNVWRLASDIDFSQMRGSVGFGLRYRSPVGPIRVDLGVKLDRRVLPTGERERPTAVHISLGQAF